MANFWQIPNNIILWAWESIRRKWDDSWFEAYNPMSGWDMTKAVYDPTSKNQDIFAYADWLVAWLLDDRWSYDASSNLFPATWWSWTAWAILKWDLWYISVAWTLWGVAVTVWDSVRALSDSPWQTASNWSVLETNIGYVPENVANKENTTLDNSPTKYPTNNLVKTNLDLIRSYAWTWLRNGCVLSINADTTKFDISAWVMYCLDNTTTPATPVFTTVSYAWSTWNTVTNIATANATYVSINSSWVIVQRTSPLTPTQRRDEIFIWVVVHSNRTVVNAINNEPEVLINSINQLYDLIDWLKIFNVDWNKFSANWANLQINKSAWSLFKRGSNFTIDPKNPHIKTMASLTAPATLRYRLQDWTEYADTNSIDPDNYDLAWVKTALWSNKVTVQRIVQFTSNLVRIQYWQTYYNTIAEALQSISSESFNVEANIAQNGLLRWLLIVKQWATDLSDLDQARFIEVNKFWDISSTAVSSWTSTLQQTYNNSIQPQITTSVAWWAVQIKRWTWADTDDVFEILNWAWVVKASVTWNWLITWVWWLVLGKDEAWWTPNIAWTLKLISAWDNAFYNTFTSWTNTANATYTLPTAMPAVSGYVLSCTDTWVMSWIASAWLAWNATIAWTSWTWLWITVSDSASAGAIGQSIVAWNTQTNAFTLLNLDTGTSALSNKAINIKALQSWAQLYEWALVINSFTSITQAVWHISSLSIWYAFNSSSSYNHKWIQIYNGNNSWAWINTGIYLQNYWTETNISSSIWWAGVHVLQYWASWTSIAVYWTSNVNSSTNWLVNYTLDNTQSGATVMQKIDTWTSAQGHTGLLINAFGASTTQRWIKVSMSTTWTWAAIEIVQNWWNVASQWILWTSIWSGSWAFTDARWIIQTTVSSCSNAWWWAFWFIQTTINSNAWYWYGIYQWTINSWSGLWYGINQNIICSWTWDAYGWRVSNIGSATWWNAWRFFSLNNAQSSWTLQARTNDSSEILFSRTWTASSWTVADNFNVLNIKRTSVQNWAWWTFTTTWSVLKLENVATQTAGTLTDTVAVLNLVQTSTTSNWWHILFNEYTPWAEASIPNNTLWYNWTDIKYKNSAWTVKTITVT